MIEGVKLGKYVLLERVAIGGMAEVFRAAVYGAEGFAKELIIKRILPDIAEEPTFVRMFVDEARIASKLDHPNIVQVFDFDCVDGAHFIAMEYVRGRDLAFVVRRAGESGKLPEAVALYIFVQLLEALRYAHEKTDSEGRPLDIIHRDISPQNILISWEGDVKLTDFGIAKAVGSSRTATGSLKGKYRYMAPEYVRKQHVDQRSDIYAAGAVLYELITNRRPFREGHDMGLLNDIAEGNYLRPREVDPSIPAAIASLIETAMELEPERRFASVRAFLDALKETCRARNIELGPEPLRRWLAEQMPREIEAGRAAEVPASAQRTVTVDPNEPATKLLGASKRKPQLWWQIGVLIAVGVIAGVIAYRLSAPPPSVAVLLRMMTGQEDWIRREVLKPWGTERDVQVPIKRYRSIQDVEDGLRADPSVSLVKVELGMLRPLVEADLIIPIDIYLKDQGRSDELEELTASMLPLARDFAMVPDHVANRLYGLPRKVETSLLVYRRSKVAEATAKWSTYREQVEDALTQLTGHGLPRDYRLERDPGEWDYYDLLVVGYYWTVTEEPRLMNRSYAYNGTFASLYDQLSQLSNEREPALAPTKAMIDLFEWEALFRELSIYREEMFSKDSVITGRALQEAMAEGQIYLTRMHSLGIKLLYDAASDEVKNDLHVAQLPLGISAQLDSEGAPARLGSRRGIVGAWFWAIPKRAPDPEAGYQLARYLTSKAVAEREAEAFLIQTARIDVTPPHNPLADLMVPVLEAQMRADAGHRLPMPKTRAELDTMVNAMVGAWWRIVVERRFIDHDRIDRRKIARELKAAL